MHSKYTLGQKLSDEIAIHVGSWAFIVTFILFMTIWISYNTYFTKTPWDPFPFILLNLVLSTIAAIQAPMIMMSQNRAAEIDRKRAEMDFFINKKAEKEIIILQKDVLEIKQIVMNQPKNSEIAKLEKRIKDLQNELEKSNN